MTWDVQIKLMLDLAPWTSLFNPQVEVLMTSGTRPVFKAALAEDLDSTTITEGHTWSQQMRLYRLYTARTQSWRRQQDELTNQELLLLDWDHLYSLISWTCCGWNIWFLTCQNLKPDLHLCILLWILHINWKYLYDGCYELISMSYKLYWKENFCGIIIV